MGESVPRSSRENRWHRLYIAVLGESSLGRLVRSRPRRHRIQSAATVAASSGIGATSRHISCEPGAARREKEKEEEGLRTATETQVTLELPGQQQSRGLI